MVMHIKVLTPDRLICQTSTDEVILPTPTGLVGILEGHATMITALETGLLRIKTEEAWTPIILYDGLAEINRNVVTVLVNDVEEFIDGEIRIASKKLEKITGKVEESEDSKDLLDASVELKKVAARVEGMKYLSKRIT